MLGKIHRISFLTLMGALLMFSSVRSQMITGDFVLKAVLDAGKVDLSWNQPENFTVSYYLVYRAEGSLTLTPQPPTVYDLIDSTTETSYKETPAPVAVLMDYYVYLVKAFNASGQSESSNVAEVFLSSGQHNRDEVTITSMPPLDATVNTLYSYQVTAVSSDSTAVLSYRLGGHPALMAMDSTGLISWVPQERGWQGVEVIVTSSKGGEARQEFTVRVAGINGEISGTVTDTLGNPLAHVVIQLYQTGVMVPGTRLGIEGPITFFDYQTQTDSTGHYLITHIDEGKYLVRATPLNPNFLPEWYDDVSDIKNATAISVIDSTTAYTADFKLENRFYSLPKFTVSGVVTDTLGNPVKGAWVVFARAGFVFNDARDNQAEWATDEDFRGFFEAAPQEKSMNHDFRLDGNSSFVYKTYVDSNGAYEDTLPEGNYAVFASANGYYRTFFNNQSSLLSAGILVLTSDTANINFKLISIPPVVLGQISGSVLDSTSGAGVAARMIAFRDIWDYRDTLKMHVAGSYFADADSTGAYELDSLPPGYYKILAIPLGSYAPSFYSLGVTGPSVRWSQATAVQIDGNTVSGVNIYVVPLPDSVSGYVSINGTVTSSNTHSGVSGALVYSADANGNIVGYGITDGSGSYTIAGMAPGTFNVFTDAVGYNSSGSYSSKPAYDASGNPMPSVTNLSITPETPSAVKESPIQPTSYALEQNYPNPFNPTTQIAFSIPQNEHVTIIIYNILGQKIATLLDGNLSAGAHVMTWDARDAHGEILPSGVYFYKLSRSSFSAVKKMLLLK